jgi:membrane protein
MREPAANRARRHLARARARWYEGSWVQDIAANLKSVNFVEWTTVFGAELLWSALPFIILLSSLADERIDDDLSRHIGLNGSAAYIVRTLFRSTPSHAFVPIATGMVFALTGIVAVVGSLQVLYERVFDLERRGWRDLPRFLVWTVALLGLLIADGAVQRPEHTTVGPVVEGVLSFAVVMIFFLWTIHFLLAGRVPWRHLTRPAFLTALL